MSGDVEISEPEITAGQKMISAMSGSCLSSLLVTPFDVVRVRLQSRPRLQYSTMSNLAPTQLTLSSSTLSGVGIRSCCREVFFANNSAEYCIASPRGGELSHSVQEVNCAYESVKRNTFNSTFDGLRKIARQEGFTTLWRGLSPTLVMGIPANIIYFTGYDWLRFDEGSPINKIFSDNWAPLVSGCSARILAGTAVSPIEMLRTRMQAATVVGGNHILRTMKGLGKTISEHGYSSLWRGLALTLWRDVPFSGIYWTGYETLKAKFKKIRYEKNSESMNVEGMNRLQRQENSTAIFMDSFLSGAISGAFASFITMPFDVGKTRRQVFMGSRELTSGGAKILAPEERPMLKFLWHILQEEGVTGLWRGWTPRALKVAPACAIMISSYEVGKRSFRRMNESSGPRTGL